MSLSGKVALVTGASRGIGKTVAEKLAREGARVVVAARGEAALEKVATAIDGVAVPMDVADGESIERGLADVLAQLGQIDILVPNAGVSDSAPYDRTTDEMWAWMMAVNAQSVLRLCRRLVPPMVAAGWGRVVIVASNAGLTGYPYTSAYCASKHAVLGLMRAMALEVARTPVTVNAVCPGWVETPMTETTIERIVASTGRTVDEAKRSLEKMSPQHRMVHVDEVAALVVSLCAESSRGIHGQAIALDGAQTMR
ncbi:MAG: SDR family NAD(P)-dependent oxidoreductase [Myxococcota bacterium]